MGCHFLCLGIFPVQGSNLHLLHWQADSLTPCHLGSSNIYIITYTYNLYIHTHVIFTPFQDQKYSLKGYLHFTHGEIITPPDSHNFLITQVFLTSNPKLSPPPDTVSAFSLHIATHQILDPGEGNGTPLQYSCLENPMDGGAWWAAVHGVPKSWTRLSDFTFTFTSMHWRRKWQPTPVFLPGESQARGSLVGCRLCGCTESERTEVT